jgi:hypothetical protein
MFTSSNPMPSSEAVTGPISKRGSRKKSRLASNSVASSSTSLSLPSLETPHSPSDSCHERPASSSSSPNRKKHKLSASIRSIEEKTVGVLGFTDRAEILQKVVAEASQKASEDTTQLQIMGNVMSLVQDLALNVNALSRQVVDLQTMINLLQQDRQLLISAFENMMSTKMSEINLKQAQMDDLLRQSNPASAELPGIVKTIKDLIPELEGIRKWHQLFSQQLMAGYNANPMISMPSLGFPGQLSLPMEPIPLQGHKLTVPAPSYYQMPSSIPLPVSRQLYPGSLNAIRNTSVPLPPPQTGSALNPLLNAGSFMQYAPYDGFSLPPSLASTTPSSLTFFAQPKSGALAATLINTQSCPSSTSSSSSTFRNP